jgi:mevalonate kinase
MEVKAPGVIKLFGEHAVVYNRLGVSAAIDMYATAASQGHKKFEIVLKDFKRSLTLSDEQLSVLYWKYKKKPDINHYIKESGIDPTLLPYATIAARLHEEYNIFVNKKITVKSDIPVQKGFASSAACSAAFTVALLNGNQSMSDAQIIDVIRDGDRVIHKNENAGAIDVGPTYYGGVVSFSKESGAKKEPIDTDFELVIIDTGPKKSTAETVAAVAKMHKHDVAYTEVILEEINKCSIEGLRSLEYNDFRNIGRLMFKNHDLLKQLGVSSMKLNIAVEAGRKVGAYGVKLSGGGGGGIAIALGDSQVIIDRMKALGFDAYTTRITNKGAKENIT